MAILRKQFEPIGSLILKGDVMNKCNERTASDSYPSRQVEVVPPHPSQFILPVPTFTKKKAAEEWVNSKFPWLHCTFTGCHLNLLNPIIRQFVTLSECYPEVTERMTRILFRQFSVSRMELSQGQRHIRLARKYAAEGNRQMCDRHTRKAHSILLDYGTRAMTHPGMGTIEFNTRHFKSSFRYFVNLHQEEKSHFHPPTNCNYGAIMTHEFAHRIFFWLDACKDIVTVNGQCENACGIFDIKIASYKLTDEISRYASQGHGEMFAEAFVSYYHCTEPVPVAVEIVEFTHKLIDAVRGTHQGIRFKETKG